MSKIITKRQLNTLIESTMMEYGMNKNEDPNESNPNEMSQEDIDNATNYVSYMKEDTMCECGGMMYEGVCEECGSTGEHMEEELHGNQYKLDKNKNNKIDSEDLEMLRKEGSVEVSVNDLAESVTKTIDTSFLTENMDNFKKLINYKNK